MADATLIELPGHIALALSLASASTGTDYSYLLKTAQRESSFQTDAKNSSSSATGLFQFIEETWIRTIKDEGERFGLKDYADRITRSDSGRYTVENPADRAAILALRKDARISALMAGAYAQRNAERIASEIGRKPTAGELYIAHFLGPTDAIRLIQHRDRNPSLSAADLFPRAAESNRTIFYAYGQPLSVGQVYDRLIRSKSTTRPAIDLADGGVTPEFGTWKPQVAKVYAVGAPGRSQALQGNAVSGTSFLDWLTGKSAEPAPMEAASVATAAVDAHVWSTTVETAKPADQGVSVKSLAGVQAKALRIGMKPSSLKVSFAPPAAAAKVLPLIRGAMDDAGRIDQTAEAAAQKRVTNTTGVPRLKIIRVPARNP